MSVPYLPIYSRTEQYQRANQQLPQKEEGWRPMIWASSCGRTVSSPRVSRL